MTDTAEAFYLPLGPGRFAPTRATESPWDTTAQHGGPPAALLATVVDDLVAAGDRMRLARISLEFLGAIPRRPVDVVAVATRPGRRVALTDATMSVDGRPVVLARAWHVATGPTPPAAGVVVAPSPRAPATDPRELLGRPAWGYGEAVEWRFVTGGTPAGGPVDVWTRVRVPLVAGRELTGLQRALVVADSANGLSAELPLADWFSIPPTMTTTLLRHPAGEWVELRARTHLARDGVGMAHGDLLDDDGLVGEVAQPLLVTAR